MNELVVQKFGGTSLATPKLIRNAANRICRERERGHHVLAVVSAMGKTTDELVNLSRSVSDAPNAREMDMLLTAGERISMALISMAINDLGMEAISLTGSQSGIITDTTHTNAKIVDITGERIKKELAKGRIVIVAGFQGVSRDKEVTTLGRGGSDTTAVALGVALRAKRCDILTDVMGVFTADPRIVAAPKKLDVISYDEMLELAFWGARVLHPRSVELARKFNLPLYVGTSFTNEVGTIVKGGREMEGVVIRGIAHKVDVTKVSILKVPDEPGMAARIFEILGRENINTMLITQAESHQSTNDISFLVSTSDKEKALALINKDDWKNIVTDDEVGVVSVVGEGIGSSPQVSGKVFRILAEKGINIDLISSSNITITCVIREQDVIHAVEALHKALVTDC